MNVLLTVLLVYMTSMFCSLRVDGHIGYPCLQESDCTETMAHSTCTGIDQSNKTCECTNGYQASRGDTACTVVLGASCNNDADCHELDGGECRTNECHCVTSKVADNNECKTKVGDTCTADSECPTNATCSDSKCRCVDTHVTDRDKCKSTAVLLKVSWFLLIAALAIALL